MQELQQKRNSLSISERASNLFRFDSGKLNRVSRIILSGYFFALSFFLFEGFYGLLMFGEKTFDLIPNIPFISYPTSAIFFSIFGFAIYSKWKTYSPLILASTWAIWELSYVTASYFIYPVSHFLTPFIWIALIGITYYLAKPKFNFTNWSAVLLFFFYGNIIYLNLLYSIPVILTESLTQLTIFIFIWKSVQPNA